MGTFFPCDGARLKLRILGSDRGELIRYETADIVDARLSQYMIARTADPQILKEILTQTLGISAVVKKTRFGKYQSGNPNCRGRDDHC